MGYEILTFYFFICSLLGRRAVVRSGVFAAGLCEVRCMGGGLGFGSAFSRRAVWFWPVGGAYFDKGEIE